MEKDKKIAKEKAEQMELLGNKKTGEAVVTYKGKKYYGNTRTEALKKAQDAN